MKVADSFELTFSFSQEQVDAFAEITGDKNPIHLDKGFAAKSIFARRIMHGFLSASVFSRIIGMHFPGNGAVYLSQNMRFLKPMFTGTEYKARVKVAASEAKNRYKLETVVSSPSTGEITIEGNAEILYKGPAK